MRSLRQNRMTDRCTAKRVMNLVHRATQGVELSTGVATFLEFALEMADDVVEGKIDLAGWTHAITHAANTDEPLRLHRRVTLASSAEFLTIEVKRVTGTGSRGHVLVVAREGTTGWVLGELLLLRMGNSLSFLLVEDAENTGGCLVVDDGLVASTGGVDAKLLINCRCFV